MATDATGNKPTLRHPTLKELKGLEKVGRNLVHATVAKRDTKAIVGEEQISLHGRRKRDEKRMKDIMASKRGGTVTHEKMLFDSSEEQADDYAGITFETTDLEDTSLQPQPGAFVELRR